MFGGDETDTQNFGQDTQDTQDELLQINAEAEEFNGGGEGDDGNGAGSDEEGGEEGDGAGQGQGQDDYFLTVNDRTKYRTREDAVKAFSEAGNRIAQLSVWDKEVAQKFGGLTPQQVQGLLLEYIQLKQAAQPGNSGSGSSKQNAQNGQGGQGGQPEQTAEEREAVEFLKKHGFITKSEFDQLMSKLDKLEKGTTQFREQTDQERLNSLVDIGRSTLREELLNGKLIPQKFANEQEQQKATRFMRTIEKAATAYINEDQERVERFYAGGDETKAVIREAVKDAIESLSLQPSQQANSLANAQRKNSVLNRNPQPLPKGGSGSQRPAKPKDEGLTSDVHRKAADLFERIVQGGAE